MKKTFLLIFIFIHFTAFSQKKFQYPEAPKDTLYNNYFGEKIIDEYQWMENSDDPRLDKWLSQQDAFQKKMTRKQTDSWGLKRRLGLIQYSFKKEELNHSQETEEENKKVYDFKIDHVYNNRAPNLLYKREDEDDYQLLIRSNDYVKNKKDNITYQKVIANSELNIAFVAISLNGSDRSTGYLFNLFTGERLPYVFEGLMSSSDISWYDGTLYYDAYKTPEKGRELVDYNRGQKLYKFKLGFDEKPKVIYTNKDTTGNTSFSHKIVDDRLFLNHILLSRRKSYKALAIADLKSEHFFPRDFLTVPNSKDLYFNPEFFSNDTVWISSNWDTPNGKVFIVNVNAPNKLIEFSTQQEGILEKVNPLGKDKVACIYFHEGRNIAFIYSRHGELLKRIDFPVGKKLNHFYESKDREYTHFNISSFHHPPIQYQISFNDLSIEPLYKLSIPEELMNLETRYIIFKSKDGTDIPMYVTCSKKVNLDGNNPALLYGYGGYGITVKPSFNWPISFFLAQGGILAVPNIRGGGAKGKFWSESGRRRNKKNAVDDFISAAEYLINEGYTQETKLAIYGSSHGGMLVGAAITQKPDLFKAAIAEAGAYDMLRYHHFTSGLTSINKLEFGVSSIKEDYEVLKSYSPLHNVRPKTKYPNTLIITGDSDDRVPPLHSYKFVAKLQELGDPTGLYLLYSIDGAGHGGALTVNDWIEAEIFKYYFLFEQLGVEIK